jgi:hypothetical protein
MRAVDAPENLRIQARLELIERPVIGRPGDLACNYVNRLVEEGGVDDLIGLDEEQPVAHLDRHLVTPDRVACKHLYDFLELIVDRGAAGPIPAQPAPHTSKSLFEPRRVNRFQQVIHGIDFKRLDRVLVKGRDKDKGGCQDVAAEKPPCDLKPADAGHLDVQEHQVRVVALGRCHGFEAVARLRDDLHVGEPFELVAQLVTGMLLVVDDHDAKRVAHAVICSAAISSGISMRAVVPSPGSLVSFN